jgi:hypothetical protein
VQDSTPLHNHRVRKKAKELFEESAMSYKVRRDRNMHSEINFRRGSRKGQVFGHGR